MQAITELDKRQLQRRLNGMEVYAQRAERRFERIRKHLQDRIQMKKAHKLVTQSMSFTIESNYQRALRERHLEQFRARQFDRRVTYVLKRMDPALKRESEAKNLLDQARFEVNRDIESNKNKILDVCDVTKPMNYLEVPSRTSSRLPVTIPELGSRFKKLGPITSQEEDEKPISTHDKDSKATEEASKKEEPAQEVAPAVQVTVDRQATPIPAEINARTTASTKLGVTTKPYYGRSRSNTSLNLAGEKSNVSSKNTKPAIQAQA